MLPAHLIKYVVEQDYARYTPVDQAVWRYILRQLRAFLADNAHPCYLDGLAKTGISVERIPRIEEMSEKMERFGWRAIPVSGFIPPAAFMELQALGYLPIASDMRTLDHLLYTPAPDIVHEAAGHAPILVDPAFAGYLKSYAQVARMAIISRQDLEQYEAIRVLSDAKEDPRSTAEDVARAKKRLAEVTASIGNVSEAARLGRMNWWTAEYGLIGSLDRPRIFGAGLLSSVGEARGCLRPQVRKIPLSVECVEHAYDITEPQPQLFVTPTFERLGEVLEEFAKTMAFRQGGREGLDKAIEAATANTAQLDSGLQISGVIKSYLFSNAAECGSDVAYLQLDGPSQLSIGFAQLAGQGPNAHPHGFGSPVGLLKGVENGLAAQSDGDLAKLGVAPGAKARLEFRSGVVVEGRVTGWTRGPDGRLAIVSFAECSVRRGDQVLFAPEWGAYDMAVGTRVASVFGGPADREAYGETADFAAKRTPTKSYSAERERKHAIYSEIRAAREKAAGGAAPETVAAVGRDLFARVQSDAPDSWLARLELVELGERLPTRPAWQEQARAELREIQGRRPEAAAQIEDGLRLAAAP